MLHSVWDQERHPDYAPSIGRLQGHRSYELHTQHYSLPAPDPRKEVMGALGSTWTASTDSSAATTRPSQSYTQLSSC
jgi:hypothetical protein